MTYVAFYGGLLLIVAGLALWILRRDRTSQISIKIFDFEVQLDSAALTIMAFGLALIFLSTKIPPVPPAPPPPPPPPKCATETLLSVKNPDIKVFAGDGRYIGLLSAISTSIIGECTPPGSMTYRYETNYHFYSGNGSQGDTNPNIHIAFKGEGGAPLVGKDAPLEIGHCVYGKGEDRHFGADVGLDGPLIKQIEISVANRGGRMGQC